MTLEEFSNEFDTLVDSYRRFKAYDDQELLDSIEFNEYEKSLFLTKAQEQLVISFYNGKNSSLDSFEKTEELRRYLSSLVRTKELTNTIEGSKLSSNSKLFKLPTDLWFITYEQVTFESEYTCIDDRVGMIKPVTQDDFYRTEQNPFKRSNQRRALRLDQEDNIVEIVSQYNIKKYTVRYLRRPRPILLVDLYATKNNVSINNENQKSECELHPALHRTILEEAVRMALQSKLGAGNNQPNK